MTFLIRYISRSHDTKMSIRFLFHLNILLCDIYWQSLSEGCFQCLQNCSSQYWAFQYVKQSHQQACLNYIDIVTEYILNISISKCGISVQNFVVKHVFQNWLSEMYFLSILRALKCKLLTVKT